MVLPILPSTNSSQNLSDMDASTPKAAAPPRPLVAPLFSQPGTGLEIEEEGSNVAEAQPSKPAPMFLLALNAPVEIPWGFMRAKVRLMCWFVPNV
jgi:hypothetical protein